ncbi:MAG: hypothetical protein ACFCUG_07095 [Thiotrichales bacterium]
MEGFAVLMLSLFFVAAIAALVATIRACRANNSCGTLLDHEHKSKHNQTVSGHR